MRLASRNPRPHGPARAIAAAALAALLLAGPAHALRSDRDQPINISADRIDIDQRKGVSTYTGSVVLVQGTMRIEADEVIVHFRGDLVETVHAKGKPVTYRQRIDNQDQDLHGSALRLEYHAAKNRVDLFDRVTFSQGRDVFHSAVLRYDLDAGRLSADGRTDKQVHSIIQPKKTGGAGAPGRGAGMP